MTDEPVNLVLRFVRRIDKRLENLESVVLDMRPRLHPVEEQIVLLRSDVVRIDHRMDRFDERMRRTERRLDLIEA